VKKKTHGSKPQAAVWDSYLVWSDGSNGCVCQVRGSRGMHKATY
jgi:hypothetical protein